jgi:hypothetical protein
MSRSNVFAIELRPQQEAREGNVGPANAVGRIVIRDFTETFRVPLGFWRESDYLRSWRHAFEVLDGDAHATSCLVTSMTDPGTTNFLVWWPVYREGEDVYIQNAIFFLGETAEALDPAAPWECVTPRCTVDEGGNKVSEWRTSMDSLREFFASEDSC